jgi:trigger factor
MATVTRENIGLLNDKLTVTISKEDYLKNFEASLRKQAQKASIPGFRKGMVPAGLIKKMYGQSIFNEEIVRLAEKQLFDYLNTEKLDIFAQPLPLESNSLNLDVNNPTDYDFAFEVGLKPAITIDSSKFNLVRYVINVDDKLIEDELDRLRTRHGKMTEPETVTSDDNVLNVLFTETDDHGVAINNGVSKTNSLLVKYFTENFKPNLLGKKNDDVIALQLDKAFEEKELDFILQDLGLDKTNASKHFNITITKVGFVEKADLNEAFFIAAFPNKEIKTEEECRAAIKEDIAAAFAAQSKNQLHDQLYHALLDNTVIEFPEAFLKRWLQTSGENPKTDEEATTELPSFINSLKWNLISTKVATDNNVQVLPEDLKGFAKNQLFSYMGMGMDVDSQPWVNDYIERMMKDKKFVEDAYYRIQTDKMFASLEAQVSAKEESISYDDFAKKLHHHHH